MTHGDNQMFISLLVFIHIQHDWRFLYLGYKKRPLRHTSLNLIIVKKRKE